jgi:hypothetical protein
VTVPRTAKLIADLEAIDAERARRAGASDPVSFARSLGFEPDPWQARVLTWTGQRLALNCCRQSGKSSTTAILALWRAIYHAGSLVLLVSPSLRQSKELLRKVTAGYLKDLPFPATLTEDNVLSVEFENGSRIVSLPSSEETIRGFSAVDLIVEDEAGDVPDDLNVAVRPMLAVSKGALILMGTPKGRRHHFFEAWERGGPAWERIQVTAAQCPRIDPAWLAAEREDLTRRGLEELFRQEYEGKFIDAASGRVYSGFDETRNVIESLPEAVHANPWVYLLGLDFGITNRNALSVLAWRKHDPCVYVVRSYKLKGDAVDMAQEVQGLRFPFSRIVGDVGGMGKAFAEQMRNRYAIPVMPAEKSDKAGNISLLNGALRTGGLKVVRSGCEPLIEEWLALAWAEGGQKEAPGENHAADATLYAWRETFAYLEPAPTNRKPQSEAERVAEEIKDFWDAEEQRLTVAQESSWFDADLEP